MYNEWELVYKLRMRVIAKKPLREFWVNFPDAQDALEAWHAEAEAASWLTPAAIKEKYRNASIIKGGRAVFDICGNKYRLVVKINYAFGVLYIRFVGTHKAYDAIDVEVV